jgi:hypothetical protein
VVEEGICLRITIKVPRVYMTRNVMILMRATPLRGPLEGVCPDNRDFLGPEMAMSEASAICARKSRLELLSGFLPPFFFLQNAIHEQTRVLFFSRFFCNEF